jgi:hypothetical protein
MQPSFRSHAVDYGAMMHGDPAVIDLERSAYLLTGFAVIGLMVVGADWIFNSGSHSSIHRGAVVTLKQPQVICRSADSIRRKAESGSMADDVVLPRILLRECRKVEAGTELTVEEIGRAVARVREKDAIESAYASTDQIMAYVPAVASKREPQDYLGQPSPALLLERIY